MADGGKFHDNQELMDNERYDEELAGDFSDSDDKQVRLCTECPANLNATTMRFEAPILLAGKGIPCLIFGEDALALVFGYPLASPRCTSSSRTKIEIALSISSLLPSPMGVPDPNLGLVPLTPPFHYCTISTDRSRHASQVPMN
ncbi:hypothetical protein D9619_002963 [Psilocybe cf. subviscida]|uniref:Uncharacterized protein n=1 Tax=Psilocybe cf. subviscida TaxID=2480587 RepID=A0A8H5EUH3_9AGAR|nr:hypothetical protein D9619_002963 [Psilocybe cf. subviscida]